MTQISRPFQIALLVLGLFVAVWFIALRGQSSSSSSSSSSSGQARTGSSTASAPTAAGEAKSAAAPTPVYHGAAPGVEGLTRAIAKAHEAVATSQKQAKQFEHESPAQSGSASTPTAAGSSAQGSRPAAPGSSTGSTASAAPAGRTISKPSMQATVEAELKRGRIVTILFWNPKSPVDRTVHGELSAVGGTLGGEIAVHVARAAQVGSFGTVTRAVQINVTPTIVIVNSRGQTNTLTGLTDAFSIEQAIDEARRS